MHAASIIIILNLLNYIMTVLQLKSLKLEHSMRVHEVLIFKEEEGCYMTVAKKVN